MKASTKAIVIVVTIALSGVSYFAGLVHGNRRSMAAMSSLLETEVTANLNFLVDYHAMVRGGELDGATNHMELRVQAAVASIPNGRDWEDLPETQRESLSVAKAYFERFPPQGRHAASLLEVLKSFPDEPLDPESCRPVMKRYLLRDAADLEGEESDSGAAF